MGFWSPSDFIIDVVMRIETRFRNLLLKMSHVHVTGNAVTEAGSEKSQKMSSYAANFSQKKS